MIKPFYEDNLVIIYCGDCREIMPQLSNISCCVTDPPYGLEFMGKEWDRLTEHNSPSPNQSYPKSRNIQGMRYSESNSHGMQQFHYSWAAELIKILKPGAMVLSFGGTRTFHRLTCGLEDAGFEIRDCLMWLQGQGFPKSHDISKAIDKQAGAKREVIGKKVDISSGKPMSSKQAKAGSGKNINDGWDRPWRQDDNHCEEMTNLTAPTTPEAQLWDGYGTALKPAWEPIILAMKPLDGTFAENALKHGMAGLNIDGSRIETDWSDRSEAWKRSGYGKKPTASMFGSGGTGIDTSKGRWPANLLLDEESARMLDEQSGECQSSGQYKKTGEYQNTGRGGIRTWNREYNKLNKYAGDSGGASRFFYVAKASASERGEDNKHPTLKPLKLMEYLVKLVAPPKDGIVIDPFMGSGTTLVACKRLGIRCIGIDTEEEYCKIATERIKKQATQMNLW